jgi:hypothetical protein
MKPREEKSHKWNRKISICVNMNKDNVQETVRTENREHSEDILDDENNKYSSMQLGKPTTYKNKT